MICAINEENSDCRILEEISAFVINYIYSGLYDFYSSHGDLQSRNERMFLLTFLVVNMADTKRKLENDVFAAAGIAQKNNCALTRLDCGKTDSDG